MKKKILVTGGSGYVGSELIKELLKKNYFVINVDLNLFDNPNLKNKNLVNIKLDILNIKKVNIKNVFACIHLASIANDPMTDLDPSLSWNISALGSKILVEYLIANKVKKIIYASSGSVYGIKKEKKVMEELDLNPISTYNKVKMVTERVLISYKDFIDVIIVRPATVCGLSDRMRLDLTVNALTYQALRKKIITVFGGKQTRPNIHIDDIISLYLFFLKKNINFGIYNAGFENLSILNIAKLVCKNIPSKIRIIKNTNDPRSYNLNSSKLLRLGFMPQKKIIDAIQEFKNFYNTGKFIEKPNFHSIQWLKKKLKKS
jgi:nucleoside-diphosphate-sugar epimerase